MSPHLLGPRSWTSTKLEISAALQRLRNYLAESWSVASWPSIPLPEKNEPPHPHVYSLPEASTHAEWYSPQDAETTSTPSSAATGFGSLARLVGRDILPLYRGDQWARSAAHYSHAGTGHVASTLTGAVFSILELRLFTL